MTKLLALAAVLVSMDSPKYREREAAQLSIERLRFPVVKAALFQASFYAPSCEVRARCTRVVDEWYGLPLSLLSGQDVEDVERIVAAIARPGAAEVATGIARQRVDLERWTWRIWPVLRVRLERLYSYEFVTHLDRPEWWYVSDPIDVQTIGAILDDLHRTTVGQREGDCDE